MTELAIQRYLRGAGKLDEAALLAEFSVKVRRHTKHQNLVCLKYDQLAAPFGIQMVRECRGIILDEADDWRVVSYAFGKFFNHGEGHAAEIDWSTSTVQEKLDGSLCVLYHYASEWHVATSGVPDASGPVYGLPRTFADLFWETYEKQIGARPFPSGRYCYYFELTSPFNRIVVPHTESRLTLLGGRDLETLVEVPPKAALEHFDPAETLTTPREFWLSSWDGIAATFQQLSPLETEGYVVCDGNFNRVKVKHPGYVALHHAKDGCLSLRGMIECARAGETSEVESAFPELGEQIREIRDRFSLLLARTEGAYSAIKHIETQKEFALCATRTGVGSALFAVRSGKAESFRHFFANVNIDTLAGLLGYGKDAMAAETKEAA